MPVSPEFHPDACIVLVALEFGLYEIWPTKTMDDITCEMALQLVVDSMGQGLGEYSAIRDLSKEISFDRFLRSLATCLGYGASANSPLLGREYRTNLSIWQQLVWQGIMDKRLEYPALVWLLFLLHGADRSFTISFEKSCIFSGIDKSGKLVLVTGHWGPDKQQVHSPIFCPEGDGGILDPGKSQAWSLSLKELTYLWFPTHADKFRKVYELYESYADVPMEKLKELRRELGLDPEFWQTQVCDDDVLPLTKHSCVGHSWVLELCGSDRSIFDGYPW